MSVLIHSLAALNRTQQRKLRRLLLAAWRYVPMYRALYEPLGFSERDLADFRILSRLPVLTKARLLATPIDSRTNSRFRTSSLVQESTTGSTGQPFSLYMDRRYRMLRNLRFLHGLTSAGYRPWQRLMLLTDRHSGLTRRRNWHYQSVERPTEEILQAFVKVRPDVLYGFATPLRLLAERLAESREKAKKPHLVVSTAEMLDAATRHTLEAVFGCPVFDFYGMTEMGLVAWQRPGVTGYIISRNAVLTELTADASCHGRYRMVMTNLDLRASPIIRFDSGDLALVDNVDGEPRVMAFEGRLIDTIVRQDGTELSPYRITDALRDVPGVRRFKVTQQELNVLTVDLEADPAARTEAAHRIRAILCELLGSGVELKFVFSNDLLPAGTRKFRPVESMVSRP